MLVSIFQNLVGSKTPLDLAKESLGEHSTGVHDIKEYYGILVVQMSRSGGANQWLRRGLTSSSVKCFDQVCRQRISIMVVIYCCNKVRELNTIKKCTKITRQVVRTKEYENSDLKQFLVGSDCFAWKLIYAHLVNNHGA